MRSNIYRISRSPYLAVKKLLYKKFERGTKGPDRMKRDKIWSVYKEIYPYFTHYKWIVLVVTLTIIFSVILGLLPPWLTRYIIDNLIGEKRPDLLGIVILAMIGIFVVKGGLDFLIRYLAEYIGQNVIHDLRTNLYRHLNRLSFSFYDQARIGDIVSRVTADTDTLKTFFGFGSIYIIANFLTLGGILVVMFIWNYKLTLIYLAILPLIIHAMRNYAYKVRPVFGQARKSLGELTANIRDSLLGIEVMKLFGREEWEYEKFSRGNEAYSKLNVRGSKISSFWMPYVNFIIGVGIALVVSLGGWWVIRGDISLGVLIGLLAYMRLLMRPIRQTGMMISTATRASAALSRIFTVLHIQPEVRDKPNAYRLPPVKGRVRFENVNFSYRVGRPALKNINIEVEPEEIVALVGPTGAGKSTLIHLIPRFYDPDQGGVFIDNHNIKDVKVSSLREQIGIVMQNIFLFGTSIAENIAYGKPEASMKEIVEVAKIAQIHDFILSLPQGYYTQIGQRGIRLSGGQKQRLAIARFLLTNPRILLMDEPTSNVDAETEDKMNRAFARVMAGRTTFIIAHRLWTITNADKIVVLKEGLIVQAGNHRQLLAQGGIYKKMYDSLQFSPPVSDIKTLKGGEMK